MRYNDESGVLSQNISVRTQNTSTMNDDQLNYAVQRIESEFNDDEDYIVKGSPPPRSSRMTGYPGKSHYRPQLSSTTTRGQLYEESRGRVLSGDYGENDSLDYNKRSDDTYQFSGNKALVGNYRRDVNENNYSISRDRTLPEDYHGSLDDNTYQSSPQYNHSETTTRRQVINSRDGEDTRKMSTGYHTRNGGRMENNNFGNRDTGSYYNRGGYVDSQRDVGGYPERSRDNSGYSEGGARFSDRTNYTSGLTERRRDAGGFSERPRDNGGYSETSRNAIVGNSERSRDRGYDGRGSSPISDRNRYGGRGLSVDDLDIVDRGQDTFSNRPRDYRNPEDQDTFLKTPRDSRNPANQRIQSERTTMDSSRYDSRDTDLTNSRLGSVNSTDARRPTNNRVVYDGEEDEKRRERQYFESGGGKVETEFLGKVQRELESQRREWKDEMDRLTSSSLMPGAGTTFDAVKNSVVDTSSGRPIFKAFIDVSEFPSSSVKVNVDKLMNKVVIEAAQAARIGTVAKTFTQRIQLPRFSDDAHLFARMNKRGILKVEVPLIYYFPETEQDEGNKIRSFVSEVRENADGTKVMEIIVNTGRDVSSRDLSIEIAEGDKLQIWLRKSSGSGDGSVTPGAGDRVLIKQYTLPPNADVRGIEKERHKDGRLAILVPIV